MKSHQTRLSAATPMKGHNVVALYRTWMCGIIGIIGREAPAPQLIDALKRLEYRGYDSAGVATLENGKLTRRRAEGKLKNLEGRLEREPLNGTIGIGHTRWATHGRPTENNAHPHATEKVAVVHNGIIELFAELRRELEATASSSRPTPIPKSSLIS
jgi:glutamine---fructose-6-phosphate transaminase (isomerizing)